MTPGTTGSTSSAELGSTAASSAGTTSTASTDTGPTGTGPTTTDPSGAVGSGDPAVTARGSSVDRLWHELPSVAFDTETTGVAVATDRIVTAALVRRALHDDVPLTSRAWLVDPGVEIPAGATAVHGISTEHARTHGRSPVEALEEVAAELAASVRAGETVVAFNASYDLTILDHELHRHGLTPLAERLDGAPLTVIDPLILDRTFDRYRKGKRTLSHLCTVYGVAVTEELHSADADASVTLGVLARIALRYPRLVEMDRAALMEFQREEHRAWAVGFNEWRERRGMTGPPVSTTWL